MPRTKKNKSRSDTATKPKYKTLKNVTTINLEENAKEVFTRRYCTRDEDGNVNETVEEAFMRVASHVAKAEKTKKLKNEYAKYFYNLLGSKRFIPNSPTWTGADTPLGQLAACFVLPISDDLGKESDGIYSTLRNAALIQQTGGGNGFSFSKIRPKGDTVSRSNGKASGPVSFMKSYDAAFGQIAQGGARRGANMAVLRVDHPDILDFIRAKAIEGELTNFNISVAITDEFMRAVENDDDFDLINPRNKKVWKTVKAREIFDEIVKYAYKNGEPGILFIDEANRTNPVPDQYELEATNPCGEQWLGPYENCCLGHVNLAESVDAKGIDWEHLKESIELGVRFLDDVVDMNTYVPSVPELKKAAMKNRRIGFGYMGLADVMYKLGIRYGSEESLDLASQLTEFVKYHAMLTSVKLAEEKGAFPGIKESIYNPKNFRWQIPKSMVEYKLDLKRPNINWNKFKNRLLRSGIRNAAQLTVAPTGTTATVFGTEGYGCEPVFALAYYRNVYQAAGQDENLQLTYVSPSFKDKLDKLNLKDEVKEEIITEVIENGTLKDVLELPEDIKNTFVVSLDIKPEEHVKMQAAIQRFVDNSISKTCNFPEDATLDDIRNAYKMAWSLGCKGLTVYVTGSRDEVVLETKSTKDNKTQETRANDIVVNESNIADVGVGDNIKRPRPQVVIGRTHEVQTPVGKAYITVNRNGKTGKAPFEVFINMGKSGSDTAALSEALGRLISGWLRSADSPNAALEEVAYQLKGIGGATSLGFGINRVSSIPDAVGKVLLDELELSKKLDENDIAVLHDKNTYKQESLFSSKKDNYKEPNKDKESSHGHQNADNNLQQKSAIFKNASVCPECGNMTLVDTEGCVKCFSCNYSRC